MASPPIIDELARMRIRRDLEAAEAPAPAEPTDALLDKAEALLSILNSCTDDERDLLYLGIGRVLYEDVGA